MFSRRRLIKSFGIEQEPELVKWKLLEEGEREPPSGIVKFLRFAVVVKFELSS